MSDACAEQTEITSDFWKLLEKLGEEHERELLAARSSHIWQPFAWCLQAPHTASQNGKAGNFDDDVVSAKAIKWSTIHMDDVVVSYDMMSALDPGSDRVPSEFDRIRLVEIGGDYQHTPQSGINRHSKALSEKVAESGVSQASQCRSEPARSQVQSQHEDSSTKRCSHRMSRRESDLRPFVTYTPSARRLHNQKAVVNDESNLAERSSGKFECTSSGSADNTRFDFATSSCVGVSSAKVNSAKSTRFSITNTLSIYDCEEDDMDQTTNHTHGSMSSRWSTEKTVYEKVVFVLRPEWEKAPVNKSVHSRKTLNDRITRWAFRNSTESEDADKYDEDTVFGKNFYTRYLLSHPRSRKRICWDVAAMVLIGYDCVNIPLQVFPMPDLLILDMMTWLIRFFWTIDMFASVCVGYYRKGVLVTSFPRILMHYLMTWFVLDLLIVGVDWFIAVEEMKDETEASSQSASGSVASLGKSLRVVRFMRTLRLLRLVKLRRIIRQVHDRIESEVISVYFSVSVTLLQLLAINHMVACAWYGISVSIGESGDTGKNWVISYELDGASVWYLYTTSLHWSLTQFTPASMGVGPTNSVERAFTVTVVLVGLVIFSSFVGRITNSTSQLWNKEAHKHRQLWLLRRYLRKNAVDKKLSSRIQQYLEYVMDQENEAVRAQDIAILGKLSQQLRQELDLDVNDAALQKHYVFGFMRDNYGRLQYRKSLEGAISSELYAKGDVLFFGGEAADCLMCIVEGDMLYKRPWDFCSQAVDQGTWICEGTLWTTWMHIGDMRTIMESTVLVLQSAAVVKNIHKIAAAWRHVRVFGARFVKGLNACEEKQLSDLVNPNFVCPAFRRGGNHLSQVEQSQRRCGCFFPTSLLPRSSSMSYQTSTEND